MNQFKDDESVQNDNHGKEMNKMMNPSRMMNQFKDNESVQDEKFFIGHVER